MKRRYAAALLAAIITAGNTFPTLAGQWQWQDMNGDGISECYYYDDNGNMLINTTTPDGYTVDSNGVWIVNGVVQTQDMPTVDIIEYDPEYPLKGMLDDLHLEMIRDEYGDVWLKEFDADNYQNEWYCYNSDMTNSLFDFRLGGSSLTNIICRLSGDMTYYYDIADSDLYDQKQEDALYQICKDFLNSFDWRNADDMTKLAKVGQLVCEAKYDYEALDAYYQSITIPYYVSYTVDGCLINKNCVCDGESKAFLFLSRLIGLKCRIVSAFTIAPHAYNAVEVDGKWYSFDGTLSRQDDNIPIPDNFPLALEYLDNDLSTYKSVAAPQLNRRHDYRPIYFHPFNKDNPFSNTDEAKPGVPL